MFTVTINGSNLEELYGNLEAMLKTRPGATAQAFLPPELPAQAAPTLPPAPAANPSMGAMTPTAPAVTQNVPTMPPTVPTAPVASNVAPQTPAEQPPMQQPVMQPPTTATALPPQSAPPTYTLDQLAKAGAALAQSGKMEQALALLAKYGVQTVNQLQPDQYGAFATELRALGAQI